MKNLLFVALVALCATFPGEVCAETKVQNLDKELYLQNGFGEIELEWILGQVVDQTGLTYNEVRSQYEFGELVIKKGEGNYEVTLKLKDGIGTILILADL